MANIRITKKPLYKKDNALMSFFKKPRFHIRKIRTMQPNLSFWDKYKEILAPFGAVAGAFLLYVTTKGAMLSGNVNINFNAGGGIGSGGGNSVINGPGLTSPQKPLGTANTGSLIELIIGYTNWILTFVVVFAVIMIIYAAVLMITAAGNPDQIGKGKSIIIWTIVALFVLISAYAIVNTVVNFN